MSEIIEQAKRGDEQAITDLINEHQRFIRNYIHCLHPNPMLADELAQDVFVKFFRSLDKFDSHKEVRPYLVTISRNLLNDYWRKFYRNKQVNVDHILPLLEKQYWEQQKDDHVFNDRISALEQCLKGLPPRMSSVINGFYMDQKQCKQLADELKTNSSGIRTLLHRARKALYKCISKRLEGEVVL